jgi:hypothetical protein
MGRETLPPIKSDVNFERVQETGKEKAFRGEYVGTNLIYGGFAKPGSRTSDPVWQIVRLTYDVNNNLLRLEYPQRTNGVGSSDYEFEWDDRVLYTYS